MEQPSASSISTRSMAGDSRMSSVSPLKARPSTPRRLPRSVQRAERTLARKRFFCSALIFSTSVSRLKSMPSCSATERKAATSLGKQEPP
jgi:hypothetical protein